MRWEIALGLLIALSLDIFGTEALFAAWSWACANAVLSTGWLPPTSV